MKHYKRSNIDYEYWKHPPKGYPYKVWWDIIAGPPGYQLSILQEYDIIFDQYDERIRRLK